MFIFFYVCIFLGFEYILHFFENKLMNKLMNKLKIKP